MKRILLVLTLSIFSIQFSCTTKATSGDITTSEVQEITIARSVGVDDFNKLLNEKGSALLIDVRTPQEVEQGYIKGARNIDISSQEFRIEVDKLDKTQPVFVYCRSGRRSAAAMRYMRDNGFAEVYNLNGGILAWEQAELPKTK